MGWFSKFACFCLKMLTVIMTDGEKIFFQTFQIKIEDHVNYVLNIFFLIKK